MRIAVLLSTYNGEKYLLEQLASLRGQTVHDDVTVFVRDDGSSDGTVRLVSSFSGLPIRISRGKNVGVVASYLELLREIKELDFDYVALCDQDDVWLPSKLERAISQLTMQSDLPTLYCSSAQLVDGNLRPLGVMTHGHGTDLASVLVRNVVTGCTCVFNRALFDHLRFPSHSASVLMHDWWLALLAASFGSIIYDPHPHILYRQHGNNQVGAPGLFTRVQRRFRMSGIEGKSRAAQARAFLGCHECLPGNGASVFQRFLESNGSWHARYGWCFGAHGPRVSILAKLSYVIWA
jgi:glycosyltransferase involved in cell wall biosynthesis